MSPSRSVATTPVLNTQRLLTQAAGGLGLKISREAEMWHKAVFGDLRQLHSSQCLG